MVLFKMTIELMCQNNFVRLCNFLCVKEEYFRMFWSIDNQNEWKHNSERDALWEVSEVERRTDVGPEYFKKWIVDLILLCK